MINEEKESLKFEKTTIDNNKKINQEGLRIEELACQSLYKTDEVVAKVMSLDEIKKKLRMNNKIDENFIIAMPINAIPSLNIMEKARGFVIIDWGNNGNTTFKQAVGNRHYAIVGRETGAPIVGLDNPTEKLMHAEKVRITSGEIMGKITIVPKKISA